MINSSTNSDKTDILFLLAQIAVLLLCVGSLVYVLVVGKNPTDIHVSLTSLVVGYFYGGRAPASGVKQMASAMRKFSDAQQ